MDVLRGEHAATRQPLHAHTPAHAGKGHAWVHAGVVLELEDGAFPLLRGMPVLLLHTRPPSIHSPQPPLTSLRPSRHPVPVPLPCAWFNTGILATDLVTICFQDADVVFLLGSVPRKPGCAYKSLRPPLPPANTGHPTDTRRLDSPEQANVEGSAARQRQDLPRAGRGAEPQRKEDGQDRRRRPPVHGQRDDLPPVRAVHPGRQLHVPHASVPDARPIPSGRAPGRDPGHGWRAQRGRALGLAAQHRRLGQPLHHALCRHLHGAGPQRCSTHRRPAGPRRRRPRPGQHPGRCPRRATCNVPSPRS